MAPARTLTGGSVSGAPPPGGRSLPTRRRGSLTGRLTLESGSNRGGRRGGFDGCGPIRRRHVGRGRAVEDPPRAGAGPRRPAAPRSRRRSPTHAQVRQAAQVGQGERARGLTFGHGAASILAGVTLARAAAASRQRAAGSGRSPSSRSAHARARRSAPLARSTR